MFGLIFLCTAQLTSFMLIYLVEKIQAFRRYVIHYKVSIFLSFSCRKRKHAGYIFISGRLSPWDDQSQFVNSGCRRCMAP